MISLAVNSVLFDAFDFATAERGTSPRPATTASRSRPCRACASIWKWTAGASRAADLRAILAETGLKPVSMEYSDRGDERYRHAFEACAELGIPVVAVGSGRGIGGTSGDADSLRERLVRLTVLAEAAAQFGVTVCCKAHVGSAVYDTPTHAGRDGGDPVLGIRRQHGPQSHPRRAGEVPKEALQQVVSRVRHSHIRDCKGRQQGLESAAAAGLRARRRGSVRLLQGAGGRRLRGCRQPGGDRPPPRRGLSLARVAIVAAESYGYLNACLKQLGAR